MTGSTEGFVLPQVVQFGYHDYHSQRMHLKDESRTASKEDPDNSYAHGVVYGSIPLEGDVEFEVELSSYGTGWSGNLKLGVMRCQGSLEDHIIPRYSPEAKDYCVWCANKVHDHMINNMDHQYGDANLDDLREGDRLGLTLRRSGNGTLQFLVNGCPQGKAAKNIYKNGWKVYIVVDHYANCRATKITRAGTFMYMHGQKFLHHVFTFH